MKIIALLLSALLIFPCASCAMEEAEEPNPLMPVEASVFVPSRLGTLTLLHDQKENDFYVDDSETLHKVKSHEVDSLLKRTAKAGALKRFQKVGYISIDRHEDGEFALKSHVRGLGGGPICAWWAYCLAKGTMYSSAGIAAGAAIGTAVVATGGGAAGVAAGAIAGGTGKAMGIAIGMASGVSTGASIGTAAIAGGVVNAVGVANVGLATGSLVAGTGSTAGVIAAVETASLFIGALFAGPWCP